MSENVIQASFASGELSPTLFARVDVTKYHSGAATMRNFFVDYRSGASTRTGTEFIRPTPQNTQVRVVRFQQSVDVTYVLEFSNNLLRFIANGGSVVELPIQITSLTTGAVTYMNMPAIWSAGNLIFISGSDTPQINNRYFIVDANGQLLNPFTGGATDSSSWQTFVNLGIAQRVYQISTPYTSSELAMLKFSQKASQLNITHPNHPPYTLTLVSATNWILAPDVFGSSASVVTGGTGSGSASGPANYLYEVTSVDAHGQESLASAPIFVNNISDMRVINATTSTAGSVSLSWTAATGAVAYNVYASSPRINAAVPAGTMVGFIGTTTGTTFVDANTTPDFQTQPPLVRTPFKTTNPQCSSYYQQRLVFANGGVNDSDHFWMSQPGADFNFNISNPSQADDSIDARLVSIEVNEIKSMIPVPSGLLMMTTKGVWQVSGGAGGVATQGGPVTPTTLTATPQAYVGASDIPPILINYDVLYVQQKGAIVRDLTYNIYANIYTGNDISVMSNHLFYGHLIREWAYAEEPFKIIWIVRDDGILLSLTILKEQEMIGWARHDTMGYFRSICTVTEGHTDAVYVVVERPSPTNPFGTVQQIERFHERTFEFGAEDAWCVDAAVGTSPNMPDAALSVFISDPPNTCQLSTTSPVFDVFMLGNIIRVAGGKAVLIDMSTPQFAIAQIIQPFTNFVPDDPLHRVAIAQPGEWSIDPELTVLHGLSHLEGQIVSILADGGVINGLSVVDGTITLPQPASKIVVGLGFQAQLQTMYLDLGQESNTVQGKRKKIGALTVRAKDSRGLKVGRTFGTLTPIKEMNRTTVMGTAIPLVTADERIIMDPLWDVPGQVCLQVDDPLPATVLGVIPEVVLGDSAK